VGKKRKRFPTEIHFRKRRGKKGVRSLENFSGRLGGHERERPGGLDRRGRPNSRGGRKRARGRIYLVRGPLYKKDKEKSACPPWRGLLGKYLPAGGEG